MENENAYIRINLDNAAEVTQLHEAWAKINESDVVIAYTDWHIPEIEGFVSTRIVIKSWFCGYRFYALQWQRNDNYAYNCGDYNVKEENLVKFIKDKWNLSTGKTLSSVILKGDLI